MCFVVVVNVLFVILVELLLATSCAYHRGMNDNPDPGLPQGQMACNKAYIGEAPLRVLARMIARDILRGQRCLNTMSGGLNLVLLLEDCAKGNSTTFLTSGTHAGDICTPEAQEGEVEK